MKESLVPGLIIVGVECFSVADLHSHLTLVQLISNSTSHILILVLMMTCSLRHSIDAVACPDCIYLFISHFFFFFCVCVFASSTLKLF